MDARSLQALADISTRYIFRPGTSGPLRSISRRTPLENVRTHLLPVNLEISEHDAMFREDQRRFGDKVAREAYISCGESALNAMLASLELARADTPKRILDFGAGAGRVTRWVQAAFPQAVIEACDTREDDLAFCRDHLGVEVWSSTTDVLTLRAPTTYGLIWVGSVLTHLNAANAETLMRKWMDWLDVGGLLVATTHGRTAIKLEAATPGIYGIDAGRWEQVLTDYRNVGYGYADYIEGSKYGVSLTSPRWIAELVMRWRDCRLVAIAESAWERHQDVIALQRLSAAPLAE